MTAPTAVIRTSGSQFLGPDGEPLLLRGVCLGGWLNMENFITGYAANETLMRREVRKVIGDDRADRFFDRLLTQFFGWTRRCGVGLAPPSASCDGADHRPPHARAARCGDQGC